MRTLKGVIFLALLLTLAACKIVPIEDIEQQTAQETFDPVAYVDSIWTERLVPAILDNTKDLPTVLTAVEADLNAAGSEFGVERSGGFNFPVVGRGTVTSVDTESRNGTAVIDLDSYDGPIEVVIQVGPLIRGDSMRDGAAFIEFGSFKDQTEFGQVSRELNARVSSEVIGDLDLNSLPGKTVDFSGVFTIRTTNQTNIDLSSVTITPITFTVTE